MAEIAVGAAVGVAVMLAARLDDRLWRGRPEPRWWRLLGWLILIVLIVPLGDWLDNDLERLALWCLGLVATTVALFRLLPAGE